MKDSDTVFPNWSSLAPRETAPSPRHLSYITSANHYAAVLRKDSALALRDLPSDTFNVAVTSPPYFWVRDYGFAKQIGHEDSVDSYIHSLMEVFDQVRRTLHPEGVFFLKIGDTYYSGNGQPHGSDPKCSSRNFLRTKRRPVDVGGWDIPRKSITERVNANETLRLIV